VNSSGCTAGGTSVPSAFSNRHVHVMRLSWSSVRLRRPRPAAPARTRRPPGEA
jgi:hypothetical protein